MEAADILLLCSDELNDQKRVRWTSAKLYRFITEGLRATALVRPDASALMESIELVPGTRQTLPAGRIKLLDVVRNMGINGNTPGDPISFADRGTQDAANPRWHRADAKGYIRNAFYNVRYPRNFFVSPPVWGRTAVFVEIASSTETVTVTADDTDLAMDSVYAPALAEWVLYRCFSLNVAMTNEFQRGQWHAKMFFQTLGVKWQTDIIASPNRETADAATR